MDKPVQILIDADSIYFRIAMASYKQKDIRNNIRKTMLDIENKCVSFEDFEMRIAIKGNGNFRHDIYDQYKATRKRELSEDERKALAYGHTHLKEKYNAVMANDMEADDLVAIWAWECIQNDMPYAVVHIDKDLNMIPGSHYNFVKDETYFVDYDQAHYNFMTQLLIGDSADNIPGIKGIGPKKAEKLLKNIPFDKRWTVVNDQWSDKKQRDISARLLWMATSFDEANCANESMLGRLEAKTLEEFWAMEVADEEPTQSETSECEPDVREEGEVNLQDPSVSGVSERDSGRDHGSEVGVC